jgi:hypothetical protein
MQAWPYGVLVCKLEEVIMDKPHVRKLAHVVLTGHKAHYLEPQPGGEAPFQNKV